MSQQKNSTFVASQPEEVNAKFIFSSVENLFREDNEAKTAIAAATRAYICKYKRQGKDFKFNKKNVFWCRKGLGQYFKAQKVYCVQEDPNDEIYNDHAEGAILRSYYEHLNVNQFASLDWQDGGNDRRIIDVGASARLINEPALINMVALQPHASFGDYLRESSRFARVEARTYNETLREFAQFKQQYGMKTLTKGKDHDFRRPFDEEHGIKFGDLLNFTDSFYYIARDELDSAVEHMAFGVVACGTCHVPLPSSKTDGYLRVGDYVFGEVQPNFNNNTMVMHVKGNPEPYRHSIVLKQAIEKDIFLMYTTKKYSVVAQVLDRFDFGATYYVRFCLIKTRLGEEPQTDADTLYARKCENAMEAKVLEGALKVGTVKSVDRDGVTFKAQIVSDDICIKQSAAVTKVGEDAVMYQQVNGEIIGCTIARDVNDDGSFLTAINPLRLLKQKSKRVIMKQERHPDFVMPVDVFNKVVKEFMKVETINRKSVKSALFLAQMNLPTLSMQRYLLPIISAALKEAFAVEARIQTILDSEVAMELQSIKNGEYHTSSNSIWTRLANWMLGGSECHF